MPSYVPCPKCQEDCAFIDCNEPQAMGIELDPGCDCLTDDEWVDAIEQYYRDYGWDGD